MRLTAIRLASLSLGANDCVKHPHATLVVSPDNQSRRDLNDATCA